MGQTPSSIPMKGKTMNLWRIAVTSHLLLLLWGIAWICQSPFPIVTFDSEHLLKIIKEFLGYIAFIIPLFLPLKGILKKNPYTHVWATIFILFYIIHSTVALTTSTPYSLMISLELILSMLTFLAHTFFARLRGKELGFKLRRKGLIP